MSTTAEATRCVPAAAETGRTGIAAPMSPQRAAFDALECEANAMTAGPVVECVALARLLAAVRADFH